jgi:hypothetical protein
MKFNSQAKIHLKLDPFIKVSQVKRNKIKMFEENEEITL